MPTASKSNTATKSDFNFEKSLTELNKLVDKMESGDLALEKSLSYFEQGIGHIKDCQKALTNAEQKVKILLEKQGNHELKDFDSSDD